MDKYRLLMTEGNWEAPTPQDAKITALEAKIQKMAGGWKSKRKGDKNGKGDKKNQKMKMNIPTSEGRRPQESKEIERYQMLSTVSPILEASVMGCTERM